MNGKRTSKQDEQIGALVNVRLKNRELMKSQRSAVNGSL